MDVLTEAIPNISNLKYKHLLENQIEYINANRKILLNKVRNFQIRYRKGLLQDNITHRCCDFTLLEEKSKNYVKVKWLKKDYINVLIIFYIKLIKLLIINILYGIITP